MIAMVDCGDIAEVIPPYLEGALSGEERGAVDSHLAACVNCRENVERFMMVHNISENTFGTGTISSDFKEKTGERMRSISSGAMPDLDPED